MGHRVTACLAGLLVALLGLTPELHANGGSSGLPRRARTRSDRCPDRMAYAAQGEPRAEHYPWSGRLYLVRRQRKQQARAAWI